MNCAELEILFCDYLDGTLAAGRGAEIERHLAQCAACAAMARDAAAAVEFIDRAGRVEPPPELLTRILFELPAARHARARAPHPLRRWLDRWIQPALQPRLAMGFAMTILSISLLWHTTGLTPRNLTAADVNPVRIWQRLDEQAYRAWKRTVKFYENLRFVYEIQGQLKEWEQKEQELESRSGESGKALGERPAPGGPAGNQGTSAPEMRNRK
ncbi:MAG: zf-HC2 domain-containing protein [Bryobacteraceae bacterium]